MFVMRLSQEQAEWVVHMDEIKKAMEEEIEYLQEVALQLAEYIGNLRSILAITGAKIPEFPVPEDNEFMQEIFRSMNGLSLEKPYELEDIGGASAGK